MSVHRRDRCTGVSSPNCMVFGIAILCTCVSVHRRDRCTRTFPFHFVGPALLFRVHAPYPCTMIQNCNTPFTKVKRTTLFEIMVCAALCSFGGFVVPLMRCPAGLLERFLFSALVGASCCLPGSVALLSVLGWALLVLFWCFAFWLAPLSVLCWFPSPAVCPFWCSGPVWFVCWYLPLSIWLQL